MAIVYKCKCCAANLDVEEGMRLVKCPACKTKQTLPSSRDENIQNLFNRATTLRLKCEFDKAEATYERIIQADEEQYEAYWGLILCKFGVEYVEDPKTETRIPTCHRTSYESIIADENYKLALKYALDDDQKALYRQEADEIDKIQQGILAVAQNEEPYDVFICYKETDENGKRTQDSVIANDIYHQLTQEGFKVFYAAITLEGKLGSAYEPIIFAALNSAKVMLAVGTKPEYFNAVWVKNEWSRFLKLNKDNRNKALIPCYKGMDPYDLPEEFAHLQAQDMGKIGFVNDIVRGIKKVVNSESGKKGAGSGNVTVQNLLKRAYLFLGDGDFANAKTYCEKALDIDAENSDAYLYELLVSLRSTKKENLAYSTLVFETLPEYKKAYAFGNEEQRRFLEESLKRSQTQRAALAERQRREEIHAKEQQQLALIKRVKAGIEKKDFSVESLLSQITDGVIREKLRKELNDVREEEKNLKIYLYATKLKGQKQYREAITEFNKILQYKDSAVLAQACREHLAEIARQQAEEERQKELARQAVIRKEKRKKAAKKILIASAILAGVAAVASVIGVSCHQINQRGGVGLTLSKDGTYYIVDDLDNAFLKKLVIPETFKGKPVKEIGDYAFEDAWLLESVVIPDSITTIGKGAFQYCEKLKTVQIGDGVTEIGDNAFSICRSLKKVAFGENIITIGSSAFDCCDSLTNVELPDSVKTIEEYAFDSCESLEYIGFGDGLTTIGESAFSDCYRLITITIPEGVQSIEQYAFSDCYRLVEVVNNSSLIIGKGSKAYGGIGFYALGVYNKGTAFESKLSNDDGYIVYNDGNEKILVDYRGTETNLTIPSYITKVNDHALYNRDNIKSIATGEGVTFIGRKAFAYGKLKKLEIGENVSYIGKDFVYGNSILSSNIIFKDTLTWYKTKNEADWLNKKNGTKANMNSGFPANGNMYCWYKL